MQFKAIGEQVTKLAKLDISLAGAVVASTGYLQAALDAEKEHKYLEAAAKLGSSIEGDPTVRREAEAFITKSLNEHAATLTTRLVLELVHEDLVPIHLRSFTRSQFLREAHFYNDFTVEAYVRVSSNPSHSYSVVFV